jgi:hypothetical protein
MAGLLGNTRINDNELYNESLDMLLTTGNKPKIRVLDTTEEILVAILEKLNSMESKPEVEQWE